ncbi:MAG: hypothetical protein ACKORE_01900 [Bacteroidota bacterium]
MIKRLYVLLLVLSAFGISSCSDSDEPSGEIAIAGLDYFPTDSGLTRIYQVDSAYWDDFTGSSGIISYQIREVQAGTFTDLQGRPAIRIERFRSDSLGNWIIDRVWSAVRTNQRAEVTEENNRIIKLVFPPELESSWNGNAYNTLAEETYRYIRFGADTAAGQTFPETATVLQGDEQGNLIELRYGSEKYARNTGRIYKKRVDLEFTLPMPNRDTVAGFIYTEKLLSVQR